MKNLFNILKLLTKKQKKSSLLILLVMIFSALLEVAGLGLIVPTIYLMSEPNYLNSYPGILENLNKISSSLGFEKFNNFSFSETLVVFLMRHFFYISLQCQF